MLSALVALRSDKRLVRKCLVFSIKYGYIKYLNINVHLRAIEFLTLEGAEITDPVLVLVAPIEFLGYGADLVESG